ncbi:MAG: lipid-binding SYLF domain-containing protein [Candidatus Binatia bacterium]
MAIGLLLGSLLSAGPIARAAHAESSSHEIVKWSAEVFADLTAGRDARIPRALLANARCVAVVPNLIKGAFGIGARYGKGILTCRDDDYEWSQLAFITMAGPSFGLQIGVQSTELVLFFRREEGVRALLRSKITLGGDISVAAGPIGRRASAEVDVLFTSDILSYASTQGGFLGVALDGGYLGEDRDTVEAYYGRRYTAEELLFGDLIGIAPADARRFVALLP